MYRDQFAKEFKKQFEQFLIQEFESDGAVAEFARRFVAEHMSHEDLVIHLAASAVEQILDGLNSPPNHERNA